MGVENNEAIIATTWNDEVINKFLQWQETDILPEWRQLFAVIPSITNGKHTIIMAPDGSKKGWDTAKEGEITRDQFIRFLESFNYEDNSSPIDWVEVGYGEFGQKVLRGNCENLYTDSDYLEQ